MQMPKRKRRTPKTAQKPFTPVPVKPFRSLRPSKTRVARVVARAKNVERRRAETQYRTKFKPKSAYEKRLFKPQAKPAQKD